QIAALRGVFASGRTRQIEWRQRQLQGIERLLDEGEDDIAAALAQDLGRARAEAWLGDIASTKGEAAFARKHLRNWMKRNKQRLPINQLPGSAWVQYEPLGVVLIIAPWNYPVYLALSPLVAAVAAGNCAVVKPSELTPVTSALLSRLIPQYLDPDAVAVVEGAAETTQQLLSLGFDHALFTGGTAIGRKVMAAAAATLTPVTLELGGKSPVIVTPDADLEVTARRIAWGRLLNSGQTCIAPDYVLVDKSVRQKLVGLIVDTVASFRADTTAGMRIVNQRQFDRLTGYLDATKGTIVLGGRHDRDSLTIDPTVIIDPDPAEPAMTEEIFGPILPVLTFDDLDAAIDAVNARDKPLALYVFGDGAATGRVVAATSSGGVCVNGTVLQLAASDLPFGGVGESGMGVYHGRAGFDTFTHRKAVLARGTRFDPPLLYPPYSRAKRWLMRRLL
ncbi:MAG: aldehyde dehydrogenase family protein, partial [Sciscionella sp.]